MGLGFIGAGGGIILLVGVLFLTIVALFFLADGILYAIQKRKKAAGIRLILALVFGILPYITILSLNSFSEAEKTRKRDFYVTATLSPTGEYLVSVDGSSNSDESVILQGEVKFHLNFPHAKPLEGRCTHFYSRRMDGEFGSLILSQIDIKNPDRSEYFADFIPRSPDAKYTFQTETYRIYFRREQLNISRLNTEAIRKGGK